MSKRRQQVLSGIRPLFHDSSVLLEYPDFYSGILEGDELETCARGGTVSYMHHDHRQVRLPAARLAYMDLYLFQASNR